MTECGGVCFFNDSSSFGDVGGPIYSLEFKLVDVPELGYLHSDKPYARGEICLRGASVLRGFYKNPELTKQVKDEEGWLHTQDIGMLVHRNALKIIDRKSNIFKLQQGVFITP